MSVEPEFTEAEKVEALRRWIAAQDGRRYPVPRHWKAAALLRGFFFILPAPPRLHRWIAANSLPMPQRLPRRRLGATRNDR